MTASEQRVDAFLSMISNDQYLSSLSVRKPVATSVNDPADRGEVLAWLALTPEEQDLFRRKTKSDVHIPEEKEDMVKNAAFLFYRIDCLPLLAKAAGTTQEAVFDICSYKRQSPFEEDPSNESAIIEIAFDDETVPLTKKGVALQRKYFDLLHENPTSLGWQS